MKLKCGMREKCLPGELSDLLGWVGPKRKNVGAMMLVVTDYLFQVHGGRMVNPACFFIYVFWMETIIINLRPNS